MTSEAQRRRVEVAGERRVEVLTAGPADGFPLVFHTGTPWGLVPYQPLFDAAAAHGLRCVLYSRPGYGNSEPQPGRRVADAAADVAAILNHLDADHFVTAGWSGGGPHALACAALLPGRCLAAATIAGVAPYTAQDLDWLAGMAQENVDEFNAALRGEAALTASVTEAASTLGNVTSAGIVAEFGGLVTAPDVAVLTGEFAEFVAQGIQASVATGIAGWRDDSLAFATEWGFAVSDIGVPVTVWQGDQDAMVPLAHGEWLAKNIGGAEARLLSGEGHMTLIARRIDAIVTDLADAGARG